MRGLIPIRALAVAALVLPAGLAVLPAGTASAAATQSVSCTKLSGSALKPTISGCNDPAVTGGSGTATINSAHTVATTKWKESGSTTTASIKYTEKSKSACTAESGASNVEVVETGTVTSGKGAAAALKGQKVTATVCIYLKGASSITISLLKGSDYKL